ncbi:MAG: glycerol-3-phosphate 1-O-acyltransferase PlsY [Ruminococcus sp.]|nr:glycerol-3-phosphate 1-O-acyltransferase PlsY [Oscillospiraceae bacterium]
MNYVIAIAAAAVIGYLLGSCNFSIIVVRLIKGEDIRTMGSKNAGLTNTLRCCGKGCAALTLIGDLGKGVLAVFLSRLFCSWLEAGVPTAENTYYIGYIAGLFAIIGHVFPLYYGFKGGKGVLVGVSTFIIIDWRIFCILICIFAVILALSKYVSLSSIIATACSPLIIFATELLRGTQPAVCLLYFVLAIPMCSTIIWMHRTNIERLRNGTENKFSFGSKKK